jgi:hypothetical protein
MSRSRLVPWFSFRGNLDREICAHDFIKSSLRAVTRAADPTPLLGLLHAGRSDLDILLDHFDDFACWAARARKGSRRSGARKVSRCCDPSAHPQTHRSLKQTASWMVANFRITPSGEFRFTGILERNSIIHSATASLSTPERG